MGQTIAGGIRPDKVGTAPSSRGGFSAVSSRHAIQTKPTETQARILQALEHLEFHGCQAATVTGKPRRPKYTFGYGVPGIVLMAWVQVAESQELRAEMRPLHRRGLLWCEALKRWPPMPTRLLTTDGRVIMILHEQISAQGPRKTLKVSRPRRRKPQETDLLAGMWNRTLPGLYLASYTGKPDGTKFRNVTVNHEWHPQGAGKYYTITEKGLALLDDSDGGPEISELVTMSQVAPLTGRKKRTLERCLQQELIPRPDFGGGGGHAHKWYYHQLRPHFEKMVSRQLPFRFPGSRII